MFLSSIVTLANSWTTVQYELNLPNRALYIKRHREEEKGGGRQKDRAQQREAKQKAGNKRKTGAGGVNTDRTKEEKKEKRNKRSKKQKDKSPGEPTRRWSPHTNSLYFFCSISIFLPRSSLRQKPASHLPLRRKDHAR